MKPRERERESCVVVNKEKKTPENQFASRTQIINNCKVNKPLSKEKVKINTP